ncbi:MAG: RNA polymerase sigma factor [Prolixibacteraceae bacterium]|nr:RNA polymerase sigma factor [Prolixibacteraceae bacterium]
MKNILKSQISDEDAVKQVQSGTNLKMFELLYTRYHEKVFEKCFSLVKNKSLAKELSEDIFSKAYEKLSGIKNHASFSSWLYSLTYNHCIDYLRYKKKLHYPDWNRSNEIPEIIDETEENLVDINYENLMKIFDLIHPEEKALLLMKYQDNLSIKQIAGSLRISEDAAKMRLKRARSRVVFLYKKEFFI